jgi:acyl-CoA thioester hydrolase
MSENHPLLLADKSPLLADFPVVVRMPIQWGDQDAFGHVNNTVAIRWFETARIGYLDATGLGHLMQRGDLGVILASITCHYRKQLSYPDAVQIGASITKIGRTSLIMKHALLSEKQNAIAAEGESVIVMFDYHAQRPIRVPQELRDTLQRVEGRVLE